MTLRRHKEHDLRNETQKPFHKQPSNRSDIGFYVFQWIVLTSTCIRVYVCAPAVSILFSKFVLSNVSPMNWLATAKNGYIYVIRQTTLFHFPSNRMNDNLVRLRWSTGRFSISLTHIDSLVCVWRTHNFIRFTFRVAFCSITPLSKCTESIAQSLDWLRERYREWEGRWLMVMRESLRPIFVVVVVQCSTVYSEKKKKTRTKTRNNCRWKIPSRA